jgi:DNA-binding transcriptional MerR regulator
MRISQLSERAGLPVGTVKFYLRTGLLHPGVHINATNADYDESHVRRIRLIRALFEVGRLSHAEIMQVIRATELPADQLAVGLKTVHDAAGHPETPHQPQDLSPALAALEELGWTVEPGSPHVSSLAHALEALANLGLPASSRRLHVYAAAAEQLAEADVEWLREADEADKVLVGTAATVLWGALFSSLRHLAAEARVDRAADDVGVPQPRRG